MKLNPTVLILAALLAAGPVLAAAAETPSADDLVEALTPGKTPKFRGLRVSNAPPVAGAEEHPAVALDIRFNLNSADLTPDAQEIVRRLGTALNAPQLTPYHFRVEGHTDASGPDDYDMALSQRRAETVRQTLIATYHVASDRLVAVGLGKTKPLDPADPMNPSNRRVQIVNVGG